MFFPVGNSITVVEMAMTHEVRLSTVEGMLGDFIAQTSKRLEEVIVEREDILFRIAISIETLKEELELTNNEITLVKRALADPSSKVGTNSKLKIPDHQRLVVGEIQRNWRTSFGTSKNTLGLPRSQEEAQVGILVIPLDDSM